jgi:hypothetical protein
MLEGFRRNHQVRVYLANWTPRDSFYGESLMGYGYARLAAAELWELTPKEYPRQFPFRTDDGNRDLSWYHLVEGQTPPKFSEHLILGELLKVDAKAGTGQFRADRTGEVVDFSLLPKATLRSLNADAHFGDLPLGIRYRFHTYQDEAGKFTRVSLLSDDYSLLASSALTWRIDEVRLEEGKLHVGRQMTPVKNYNGDFEKFPDIGRAVLLVTPETRVWKDKEPVKLSDLKVDDALLVNVTGEQTGAPSHCADIWVVPPPWEGKTLVESKK